MKFFLTIAACIYFSLQSVYAGDEVNNGGGLSEQKITHAYLNLKHYIDLCLHMEECRINQMEQKVLQLIVTQLPEEYQNQNQILFSSERKNPGFFVIDGELKVAKTGSKIASPIYFNLDLLYSQNGDATISFARAISLLVHELGHHNNSNDNHTFLDLLGNKVALLYSEYNLTTPLTAAQRNIQLNVFNKQDKKEGFPNILLRVQNEMIDLSQKVEEALKCPKAFLPLGVQIRFEKPKGARLHNLHWTKIKEKDQTWNFSIQGNLSNFCEDQSRFLHFLKNFKVNISFKAIKKINQNKVDLTLKKESISVQQIYDPWIKFFDIPII